MTTMTLARPVRRDADGYSIRRVEVPVRAQDESDDGESWARLSLGAACALCAGIIAFHLAPHVGWMLGMVDGMTVVAFLAVAVEGAHLVTPIVQEGLRGVRVGVSSALWQLGVRSPRRGPWLPPLPNMPLRGGVVIIPWHGHLHEGSVIVRHVKVARTVRWEAIASDGGVVVVDRPPAWALIYREGHIVAAAQIRGQEWQTPRRLAWTVGRRLGITARTYRTYAAGHARLSILHIGGIWTIPQPVALTALGITGPLGSHRYLEKEKK